MQSRRAESQLAGKELAAKEAVGRSLLAVQQSIEHYAVIQRVAAAIPYGLIALAAIMTIGVGFYVRERLLNSGRERRQETIERMLQDPPRSASEPVPATSQLAQASRGVHPRGKVSTRHATGASPQISSR